jgi:hypothetical protein
MSDSSKQVSLEIAALSERIEMDSKLGENYFNTVTSGFIGFSQAISPLLKTADSCCDMLAALTVTVGQWAADDFTRELKTGHLLWKFGIYSQLIGIASAPPQTELAALSRGADNNEILRRVDDIQVRCQQLGAALVRECDKASSKELLAGLEKMEATSELLLQALDQLQQ